MLTTTDLQYQYTPEVAFRFPDIRMSPGEHGLLLGASGSGKTTLLHLLAGLLRPGSGQIQLGDTRLDQLSEAQLDRFRGSHIGIVFQRSHFVEAISVKENLLLAQGLAGRAKDPAIATGLLKRLGLGKRINQLPARLSQGEQQRVAIARALINEPLLLLADEPTSALDDHHAEEVIQLLQSTARTAGAILLVVTHDNRLRGRLPREFHLQNALV